MARRSGVDKALADLEARKQAILEKANSDIAGLQLAIEALRANQRKAPTKKPRIVAAASEKVGA